MLQCLELVTSDIWNPLGIFICMLLSKDPYKYAIMTSMRHIVIPSKIAKQIWYLNVIMSIIGEYVSS